MGTTYRRGSIWWIGYKGPSGWIYQSSGQRDRRNAQRLLDTIEAKLEANERLEGQPMTVAAYAKDWADARDDRNWTAKTDLSRLTKHVFPALGAKKLSEVRAVHVRELVAKLRYSGLASRTVRNIYGALHRMFQDAVAMELIDSSPCVLMAGDLPVIQDKDPAFRKGAEYSREEVEALISDVRLPFHHRLWWAFGFLTGMRAGEVSALRWRDYDESTPILGRITVSASYTRQNHAVKGTKTGRVREVPVHPTLAAFLSEWRLAGFQAFQGLPPKPDDLLLPNAMGGHITDNTTRKTRPKDLATLGLRLRRFHDARSTFCTLGTADGGEEVWLERVTHNAKGNQFSQYRRSNWPALCRAVSCLRIRGPVGVVLHASLHWKGKAMDSQASTYVYDSGQEGTRTLTQIQAETWRRVIPAVSVASSEPGQPETGALCSKRSKAVELADRAKAVLARFERAA